MTLRLSVGILGAGSIGTLLATLLSKAGFEVVCMVKDDQVEPLKNGGLVLESALFGTLIAYPRCIPCLDVPLDVLFVTVKSPFLFESLERIPAGLGRIAVSLLNGTGSVELMREKLSGTSVLGTIGRVEVETISLGHAKHIGTLTPHIEMAGSEKTLKPIARALSTAGLSVTIREKEADVLWGKLARLNALASVTALSGKTIGEVREDRALRARFKALVEEGVAIAVKEGVVLQVADILAFMDRLPYEMTTSLARDIAAGAPSELESITGGVLKKARMLGVETPVLEETYRLLESKLASSKK